MKTGWKTKPGTNTKPAPMKFGNNCKQSKQGNTMQTQTTTPRFIRIWSVQFPCYTERMKAMNSPQAVHDALRLAGKLALVKK